MTEPCAACRSSMLSRFRRAGPGHRRPGGVCVLPDCSRGWCFCRCRGTKTWRRRPKATAPPWCPSCPTGGSSWTATAWCTGHQLFGLHAGDHALPAWQMLEETIEELAKVVDIHQLVTGAVSSACMDESRNFESLPIRTRLTDTGSGALHGAALPVSPAWTSRRGCSALPAGRGGQPCHRLHRPHQPDREGAHPGFRRRGQLPGHGIHRQTGHRAELRDGSCTAPPGWSRWKPRPGGARCAGSTSTSGHPRQTP